MPTTLSIRSEWAAIQLKVYAHKMLRNIPIPWEIAETGSRMRRTSDSNEFGVNVSQFSEGFDIFRQKVCELRKTYRRH